MRNKIVGILICTLFIGTSIIITPDMFVKTVRADITAGLVGYWSFDDRTATDNSDNNNDGTIYGDPVYIEDGGPDGSGCFSFDGINDYININDVSEFMFTNQDVSFSVWVQIYDNPVYDYRYFISLGDGIDEYPEIELLKCRGGVNDGKIDMQVSPDDNTGYPATSILNGNDLPKYEWMHVVGVVDYTNSLVKLYINNEYQGSNYLGSYDLTLASDLVLHFGVDPWFNPQYPGWHNGLLDEVRIYNRALSQIDIQELYNQVMGKPVVTITNPKNNNCLSKTITITGSAYDDTEVELVQVKIDDGQWENCDGTIEWSYEWDSKSVNDGSHLIYARCIDNDNFLSNEKSVEINVDNEEPQMYVNNPRESFFHWRGKPIMPSPLGLTTVVGLFNGIIVQVSASDEGCGIDKVNIYIDDELRGPATYNILTKYWEYDWNENHMGRRTLKIVVIDLAGNEATGIIYVNYYNIRKSKP